MLNLAQRKRQQQHRDAQNEAARALLPRRPSISEQKARAERIMAEHDTELEAWLGL